MMNSKKLKKIKEQLEAEKRIRKERFIELAPTTPTDINSWREVINGNFPDLLVPAEIGLSVIAQLLIEDIKNPFALVYVDVPSSGKTITLNFFSTIQELAFTTDNFTPASFVSNAANKKKEELEQSDMLPQIRYKALIIRDLAPIFGKKDEDVQAMLGILIRVLDGEGLEVNSGLYGKRGYVGEYLFMMLSASTPFRPRIWKVMGNLGSRLFFVVIGGKEKSEDELAKQLKDSCKEKEIISREVTQEFIKTLWSKYPKGINWDKKNDDHRMLSIIAKFAKILAKLRSSINVWEDSFGSKKYNYTQPITEMPDRLNQLLYNLARGHALVCSRENLTREDLSIVKRVALDSAPPNRAKIFQHLIRSSGGRLCTTLVIAILKCSRPTALKEMRQLAILGIVRLSGDNYNENKEDDPSEDESVAGRPEAEIILLEDFDWFLSAECQEL